MQCFRIKATGKKSTSLVVCLFCLFCLVACVRVNDYVWPLQNGYAVVQSSANSRMLIHNKRWQEELPEEWSGPSVIDAFFIKGFCNNDVYISVYGIHTENFVATDREITSNNVSYYLINASTHEKWGPFGTAEELYDVCETLDTGKMGQWTSVE